MLRPTMTNDKKLELLRSKLLDHALALVAVDDGTGDNIPPRLFDWNGALTIYQGLASGPVTVGEPLMHEGMSGGYPPGFCPKEGPEGRYSRYIALSGTDDEGGRIKGTYEDEEIVALGFAHTYMVVDRNLKTQEEADALAKKKCEEHRLAHPLNLPASK